MRLNGRFSGDLFIPSLLIFLLGWLTVFSTAKPLAQDQLGFALLALVVFVVLSRIPLSLYETYGWLGVVLVLGLLLGLSWGGEAVRGSVRWLSVGGLNLQPSELAKLAVILVLAKVLTPLSQRYLAAGRLGLTVLAAGPFFLLVFRQPDLGTALIILAIWLITIFYAGVRSRNFLYLALLVGASSYFLWSALKPYQQDRLVSFLDPSSDPQGSGYHVLQSMIAVGSGRLVGRGFGRGTQSHLKFLPEFHTDFAFASFAEEWGFVGVAALLVLYGILLRGVLRIARESRDDYGVLVAVGVFGMLFTQIFVNIGMNVGLLPVTGVPLPLVSYGGTSLLVTAVALALLQSVANSRAI